MKLDFKKFSFKKMSIQWKIYLYISAFCAILLAVLWLAQIVFLDDIYQAIKLSTIRSNAKTIEKNITDDELTTIVEDISDHDEVCICIMKSTGEAIASSDVVRECIIHKIPSFELYRIFIRTEENGGELLETYDNTGFRQTDSPTGIGKTPPTDENVRETIVYSKVVTSDSGARYIILLNSVIRPVDATVQTLRIQLYCITAVMILLTAVIGFIMARKISKPIVSINNSAHEMAKGNYNVHFEGEGYKEIEELNQTLNYAAAELSQVEQLRRELIANISHDLRTPLTLIEGYGEVMRDIPGENTPENVQVIIDETRRLSTLVSDILDISKLQSGTQTLEISTFNITQTVRTIVERVQKMCVQNGYRIDFEYNCDVFVDADETRISQVIYNLLGNAINYTGDDKKVQARQIVSGDKVMIEITDTGNGIEPDKLSHVWERYYKIDKTHRRAMVGTGLGLTIIKSIIDLHKEAECGVISELGKGSTFWFKLKIKQ